MILVTVGTQIPFDRLVNQVAHWHRSNSAVEIVAQVGRSGTKPAGFWCEELFEKADLDALTQKAELIVSHAGIGSILSAFSCGTPIIVMPRRLSLGEHRNDHQIATAKALQGRPGLAVAWDEIELVDKLNRRHEILRAGTISRYAPQAMISNLRQLLND